METTQQIKKILSSRDKLIIVGLTIVLILLGIFAFNQTMKAMDSAKLIQQYKERIINKNQLIEVSEGEYNKVVNDLNTERSLSETLYQANKQLHERVVDLENKKPIIHTKIIQSAESKTDTVYVKDGNFIDWYPNESQWYVKYTSKYLTDSTRIGVFEFNPIKLDLVISEVESGIFEADIKGPDFVKINSLEVTSLPLKNLRQDNFDWLLGGQVGYSQINQSMQFKVLGGVRIKRMNYLGGIDTRQTLWFGAVKSF